MANVETVKVKAETEIGFMIINKHDFDKKRHELLDGELLGTKEEEMESDIEAASEKIDELLSENKGLADENAKLKKQVSDLEKQVSELASKPVTTGAEGVGKEGAENGGKTAAAQPSASSKASAAAKK